MSPACPQGQFTRMHPLKIAWLEHPMEQSQGARSDNVRGSRRWFDSRACAVVAPLRPGCVRFGLVVVDHRPDGGADAAPLADEIAAAEQTRLNVI
jgi:hypothetical protein